MVSFGRARIPLVCFQSRSQKNSAGSGQSFSLKPYANQNLAWARGNRSFAAAWAEKIGDRSAPSSSGRDLAVGLFYRPIPCPPFEHQTYACWSASESGREFGVILGCVGPRLYRREQVDVAAIAHRAAARVRSLGHTRWLKWLLGFLSWQAHSSSLPARSWRMLCTPCVECATPAMASKAELEESLSQILATARAIRHFTSFYRLFLLRYQLFLSPRHFPPSDRALRSDPCRWPALQ